MREALTSVTGDLRRKLIDGGTADNKCVKTPDSDAYRTSVICKAVLAASQGFVGYAGAVVQKGMYVLITLP